MGTREGRGDDNTPKHPILFPWNTIPGRRYGCGITMHDSFLVHPQLCFVVSFVLRVPGLEEGGMFSALSLS